MDGCVGWSHCIDCGGVCSTDDVAEDPRPYQPQPGLWAQKPIEIPGPDYLDRFRNYRRDSDMTVSERMELHRLRLLEGKEELGKDLAAKIRAWHRRKQQEREALQGRAEFRPISFEELARDVELGKL
jgi:hypothetical protein